MRGHRGPRAEDAKLFAPDRVPVLRQAVADLSWLHTRGYAPAAAGTLVGDRFQLQTRQRDAVGRAACSDQALAARRCRQRSLRHCRGLPVVIDGFNLLITLESALAGGYLFRGRDGLIRDLASVHGSWRRVAETERAALLAGEALREAGIEPVTWLLDAPVANSGRLRRILEDLAAAHHLPWTIDLSATPDGAVASHSDLVISADRWILDRAPQWINLTATLLPRIAPPGVLIDLAPEEPPAGESAHG